MAEITWKSILTKLVGGDHLTAEESEWFVDDLMQGNANPAAVGAALAMQQQLGLTADEVCGAAKGHGLHAVPLNVSVGPPTSWAPVVTPSPPQTCPPPGSIIAAAAGVKIVKHGSRAHLRSAVPPMCSRPRPAAGLRNRRRGDGRRGGHHLRVRPHLPPGHAFRGVQFVPRSASRASSASWDR